MEDGDDLDRPPKDWSLSVVIVVLGVATVAVVLIAVVVVLILGPALWGGE